MLQSGLPALRAESTALANTLQISLSRAHAEIKDNIEEWCVNYTCQPVFSLNFTVYCSLRMQSTSSCQSCILRSFELQQTKEMLAQSQRELEQERQERSFQIADMQSRMDEWCARYSAANMEAANFKKLLKNIQLEEESATPCISAAGGVRPHDGVEMMLRCRETEVDSPATPTMEPIESEAFPSEWHVKYSHELQKISAMHASIIHMGHKYPIAADVGHETVLAEEFDSLAVEVTRCPSPEDISSQEQLDQFRCRIIELECECNRLEKCVLDANSSNTELRADLAATRSVMTTEQNKFEATIHKLKNETVELVDSLSNQERRYEDCNTELTACRHELELVETQLKSASDRSAELQNTISQLQSNMAAIAVEKSQVDSERDELLVKLSSAENELISSAERYESDICDLRSQYEGLRRKCAETEDKMWTSAERNAKTVYELTVERDSLRMNAKELQHDMESKYLAKIRTLQADSEASERSLTKRFEEELTELRNKCASYQHSAENSEKELMDVIKSLNIIEIKYQHVQQLYDQMQSDGVSPDVSVEETELVETKTTQLTASSDNDGEAISPNDTDNSDIVPSLLSQLEYVMQEAQSREQEWGRTRASLTAVIEEWRNKTSAAMTQSLALEKSCLTLTNEKMILENEAKLLRENLRTSEKEIAKLQAIVRSLECEAVRLSGEDTDENSRHAPLCIDQEDGLVAFRNKEAQSANCSAEVSYDLESVRSQGLSSVRASGESFSSQVR